MLFVRDYLSDQKILKNKDFISNPVVSVILPTFKRRHLLERSIKSVQTQTYTNFELIIVDDGSTDGSFELIQKIQKEDNRIIHIRHEKNCGLPGLRVNEGIEIARGKYLTFQFDDDVWRPHALQKLIDEAEKHSEPIVVVGRTLITGKYTQIVSPWYEMILANFTKTNFIANNSVMFTKSLVDIYGMYDPHVCMRRLCDWDLWQRLVRHVYFCLVEDIIADVFSDNVDSIGKTAPLDIEIIRYFLNRDRNALLTPVRWREYEVDSLSIENVPLGNETLQRQIISKQLIPFYKKMHIEYSFENIIFNQNKSKLLLYGLWAYDAIKELAFGHYEEALRKRGDFQTIFEFTSSIKESHKQVSDLYLLIRPFQPEEYDAFSDFYYDDKPTAIYYDDDFLNLYEAGEEFQSMAPGSETYSNILEMVEKADAIWLNSITMNGSYREHNPRLINTKASIPHSYINNKINPLNNDKPIKIGYVGNKYRIEEFRHIWPALIEISNEFKDKIVFEFWGFNPEEAGLQKLSSKVTIKPFELNYFHFLDKLQESGFDILLSPLLGTSKSRLAKGINKYYLCGVAGALGIFSDVAPYKELKENVTCMKTENTVTGWYSIIKKALSLSSEEFDLLRNNMIKDIYENYTEEAQIESFEAAFRATELHGLTRYMRDEIGKPNIFFIIEEKTLLNIQLIEYLRIAELAKLYSIEPVFIIFLQSKEKLYEWVNQILVQAKISFKSVFEDFSLSEWNDLVKKKKPFLIHSFGNCEKFISEISIDMSLPVIEEHNQLLCVPEEYFDIGFSKIINFQKDQQHQLLKFGIVVNKDFQILENILDFIQSSKINKLILLISSQEFSEDKKVLTEMIERHKELLSITEILDITHDNFINNVDMILCLSPQEIFPHYLADAMAGGILTIAPRNEITQDLIDLNNASVLFDFLEINSICKAIEYAFKLTKPQKLIMLEKARSIAKQKFHPKVISNNLLKKYISSLTETIEGKNLSSMYINTIIDEPNPITSSIFSMKKRKSLKIHSNNDNLSEIEFAIKPIFAYDSNTINFQIETEKNQIIREIPIEIPERISELRIKFTPIKNSRGKDFKINLTSKNDNFNFFTSTINQLYYKVKYRKNL